MDILYIISFITIFIDVILYILLFYYKNNDNNVYNDVIQPIYDYNILISCIIFWLWAIFNIYNNNIDLGVITFLLIIISHIKKNSLIFKVFKVLSYFILILNYIIGIILYNSHTKKIIFRNYCIIFTIIWACRFIYIIYRMEPNIL